MHYYQFNIGDYSSHTSRLSLLEDLAYRRLLDLYYLSEQPISGSFDDISRDIGMMDHINEIEYILNKFFILEESCWLQCRVEKEIKHYQSKIDNASKAGKASAKARRSKGSEQAFNDRSTTVQPTNNQEPITNNHKPINKDQDKGDPPKRKRFVKPTYEQILEQCHDPTQADKFLNHYESNGWKVGRNKMANWKACLTNWMKRQEEFNNETNKRINTGSNRNLSAVERVRQATGNDGQSIIDITPYGHTLD